MNTPRRRALSLLVIGAVSLAAGNEAARLAPSPADLAASAAETEARVARAEAIGVALIRVQNGWGEMLATGKAPQKPCDDPGARSLFARAAVFGPTWRDAAQAARAERDRLVEIAAAPTVAPLVGDDTATAIKALLARVAAQESRYVEATAWQRAYMLPPAGCDRTLEPIAGLSNAAPSAPGESVGTAVIGLGGGRVCPVDAPADGTPVVTAGLACVSAGSTCDCAPTAVAPAAVLGPVVPVGP